MSDIAWVMKGGEDAHAKLLLHFEVNMQIERLRKDLLHDQTTNSGFDHAVNHSPSVFQSFASDLHIRLLDLQQIPKLLAAGGRHQDVAHDKRQLALLSYVVRSKTF